VASRIVVTERESHPMVIESGHHSRHARDGRRERDAWPEAPSHEPNEHSH